MVEVKKTSVETDDLEEENIVEPIQPTTSMDIETIEILLEDRIATGG
jgi:hypothetical protein